MEVNTIRDLTVQIRQAMDRLRQDIQGQLDSVEPMDGVRMIGPRIGTVSMSAVMNSPGHILAPSYYLPGIQAEAVSGYLLKDDLMLDQIQERLDSMISSRSVVCNGEKIWLNSNTLHVLTDLQKQFQEA